jgi:hypothetical protein
LSVFVVSNAQITVVYSETSIADLITTGTGGACASLETVENGGISSFGCHLQSAEQALNSTSVAQSVTCKRISWMSL